LTLTSVGTVVPELPPDDPAGVAVWPAALGAGAFVVLHPASARPLAVTAAAANFHEPLLILQLPLADHDFGGVVVVVGGGVVVGDGAVVVGLAVAGAV